MKLSELANGNVALVLYYSDAQVDVSPEHVIIRNSEGQELTSFDTNVFSDIIDAFNKVTEGT
jgi:hypothetical protein